MAARIRKIKHDEDTRLKIRAGNLITRIQKFVLANMEEEVETREDGTVVRRTIYKDDDGNLVHAMSQTQMHGALALLNKVLPNLTSVDVKSDETKTYVLRAPPPEKDMQSWLQNYGPAPAMKDITPKENNA